MPKVGNEWEGISLLLQNFLRISALQKAAIQPLVFEKNDFEKVKYTFPGFQTNVKKFTWEAWNGTSGFSAGSNFRNLDETYSSAIQPVISRKL